MQLRYILIKVDDQDKALAFYTSVIGFVKKHDDDGGRARWLTVVAPDDADGTELVLEPNSDAPRARRRRRFMTLTSRRHSSPPVISTANSTGSPALA